MSQTNGEKISERAAQAGERDTPKCTRAQGAVGTWRETRGIGCLTVRQMYVLGSPAKIRVERIESIDTYQGSLSKEKWVERRRHGRRCSRLNLRRSGSWCRSRSGRRGSNLLQNGCCGDNVVLMSARSAKGCCVLTTKSSWYSNPKKVRPRVLTCGLGVVREQSQASLQLLQLIVVVSL